MRQNKTTKLLELYYNTLYSDITTSNRRCKVRYKKMTQNKTKKLLELYRCIRLQTANAETFEDAIKEQGLTMEIITIMANYYEQEIKEGY
jgi:hypothetical protein